MAVTAILLVLLAVLRFLKTPSLPWLLAVGLSGGVTAALRPNFLLLLPALALGSCFARPEIRWSRRIVEAVLFSVMFYLPILPIAWRNYAATGEWIPLSDNGGLTFYFGSNPYCRGGFGPDPRLFRGDQAAAPGVESQR